MKLACLSIVFLAVSGASALSHEFWIEPQRYQVESGDELVADLRNGENFKGISLGWFERRFSRFEMVSASGVRPVLGRMGDTPALRATAPRDGLLVVVHETTPSTVTYRKWEKFLTFVEHKNFTSAVAEHEARGWPKENFRESYTRHAKALIAVGSGEGADRPLGLATEFVALTNPYSEDFEGAMRVQVNYQGKPRRHTQVETFERDPSGSVAVTLYETDAEGVVAVPVRAGHSYLFDAVVIRPLDADQSDDPSRVWETLWAALTFAVPAR